MLLSIFTCPGALFSKNIFTHFLNFSQKWQIRAPARKTSKYRGYAQILANLKFFLIWKPVQEYKYALNIYFFKMLPKTRILLVYAITHPEYRHFSPFLKKLCTVFLNLNVMYKTPFFDMLMSLRPAVPFFQKHTSRKLFFWEWHLVFSLYNRSGTISHPFPDISNFSSKKAIYA
jgi:hypothetical protein